MGTLDKSSRREFIARAAVIGAGTALPGTARVASAITDPATERATDLDPAAGTAQAGQTYATIDRLSWDELLADRGPQHTPPLTVHLPIQPVHSPDFVHVDCALNASRRRVVPGLSTSDKKSCQAAREMETFVIQFAAGDPPWIFDFRRAALSQAEGRYPVAHAEYFAADLRYEFDYSCAAIDPGQSLLCVSVAVTNEGEIEQPAHVRAKVNFQRECDIHLGHYVPFFWDQTKWPPCKGVRLEGDRLWRDSTPVGRVLAGSWSALWEATATFADKDYNRHFNGNSPHYVVPHLRLKQFQDAIHFSTALQPGERKSFSLALLVNYEKSSPGHLEALARMEPEASRRRAEAHFRDQFTSANARLVCPVDRWDQIFGTLQLSTLQLLVGWPNQQALMPTQGGSNERHFVWVWEAMCMLRPMLRLGHFAPVRRALDFVFSLQDAGCPPEGEVTTTAGAIGTTGPKWLNSTGSALVLAADYYLYSGDRKFLEEYTPKILRAMEWIWGEIRATRKLAKDGSRPLWYGLMPFGCATDGDIGYIIAFTDAYTFWGCERAVALLERVRHPRAEPMRLELEQYRADLGRAIAAVTREDGYIERKILTGREPRLLSKFERICGAIHLAYVGALDARGARFGRHMAYVEDKMMDGFFAGRMDRDVMYMGIAEPLWHHTYLRLGQWKKAFAALRCNLGFGMTQDAFQVQERFSLHDPAFTPWQPNGSGNGRILEMMLNSLFFEHDGVATLLGGMPWTWLRRNGTTRLEGLHTPRGRLSLEATMVDARHCRLVLGADAPGVLPTKIRLPDHFEICQADPVPARGVNQGLELDGQAKRITLLLGEVPL